MQIFLIILYLLSSVGGLTLVKVGAADNGLIFGKTFFNLSLSYTTLIGLILYIISFLLWIVIIGQFNLSYIQPITAGLSYVLIILVSVLILKESVTLYQWAGLGFILIGVILMNLGQNGS